MDAANFFAAYWWAFLIAAGVGVAAWFFLIRKKKPKNLHHPVPWPERFNHQYERPDGGHVVSIYPIPESVRAEALARIVRGLQRTIDASQARNPSWRNYLNTRDFDIVHLVEPMKRNMDGSPALMVYGQYQSAGTVWNVWSPNGEYIGPPYLVLPDQGHPDYGWRFLPYFEESVRNESEHAREWVNSYAVFLQFTGPNDVHPHWPEVNRLVAVETSAACCGVFQKGSAAGS